MQALVVLGALAPSAARTVNLTVYRITPRNYTGLRDMDSGDAAGDAFFGLYELSFPILCANPRGRHGPGCRNEPILSIPGFNVYTKSVVEADARFGDYSQCNPNPDTGVFECTHFRGTQCWHEVPRLSKAFAGLCDPKRCKCDYVEKIALGAQSVKGNVGPPNNGTLPPTCAKSGGLVPVDGYALRGWAYKNESGTTAGECCTRCASETRRKLLKCEGYTFVPDASGAATGRCSRFGFAYGSKREPGAQSAYAMPAAGGSDLQMIFHALGELSTLLGGNWYSTRAEGECAASGNGSTVGSDCWWKLRAVDRVVNATCANGRVISQVLKTRPSCFEACPQPTNRSSTCWIRCLFETLTGNATRVPPVPPMSRDAIVQAFEGAFEPEAAGGCEQVPPCPPPCKPPAGGATGMALRPSLPYGLW